MRIFTCITILLFISCHYRTEKDPVILSQSSYFEAIGKNDTKISPPQKGEWRYEYKNALREDVDMLKADWERVK